MGAGSAPKTSRQVADRHGALRRGGGRAWPHLGACRVDLVLRVDSGGQEQDRR